MPNTSPRNKAKRRRCHRLYREWSAHPLLILLTFVLFMLLPLTTLAQVPQLSSDSRIATAGYFRLSWTAAAGRVELQEASDDSFRAARIYYKGSDHAALISGKANGTWYYRIRAIDDNVPGPWSTPLAVTVAHHPLSRALLFFSLGLAVFIAIVLLILRGPGEAR